MSQILDFLRGTGTDDKGRTLSEILGWSDEQLENSHDTIQWLFPLNVPSNYNSNAPVLSDEEIEIIKKDELIQKNIIKSYYRFVRFYNDFDWVTPNNHNYLRLTRILKSLRLTGLYREQRYLKGALDVFYFMHKEIIGKTTKKYWDQACKKS